MLWALWFCRLVCILVAAGKVEVVADDEGVLKIVRVEPDLAKDGQREQTFWGGRVQYRESEGSVLGARQGVGGLGR